MAGTTPRSYEGHCIGHGGYCVDDEQREHFNLEGGAPFVLMTVHYSPCGCGVPWDEVSVKHADKGSVELHEALLIDKGGLTCVASSISLHSTGTGT